MTKSISLLLLSCSLALASGTVTPGSRPGGANRCATSTIEGAVSKLDVEGKRFTVAGANATRDFKVAADTLFRIPGVDKDALKNAPLSKVSRDAKVKVFYCTKDGSPVEVKVER